MRWTENTERSNLVEDGRRGAILGLVLDIKVRVLLRHVNGNMSPELRGEVWITDVNF